MSVAANRQSLVRATSLGFTSLSVVGVRLSGRHDTSCRHPAGSTQRDLYEACAARLVDRFLGGANACLLAYGQTASGKTFTAGTDGELARLPRKPYIHSAINVSRGENLPARRSHSICAQQQMLQPAWQTPPLQGATAQW